MKNKNTTQSKISVFHGKILEKLLFTILEIQVNLFTAE